MSPPACASRAKFRWGIAFATGLKRYMDPETGLRMKHTNRKCQIPRGLRGKMRDAEREREREREREMTMIAKDGSISKFPEYHSSEEEEPTEQPRSLNKYGFVDHPQLQIGNQMEEFAPHLLPQQEGNMNGWLIEEDNELERNEADIEEPIEDEEEEEPMEEKEEEAKEDSEKKGLTEVGSNSKSPSYAAIEEEVGLDYESTTRSEPKCRELEDTCESEIRPKPYSAEAIPDYIVIIGGSTFVKWSIDNYGGQHNYTCITTQVDLQLQALLLEIVTQVTNNVNNANNGNGGNGNGENNICSYKGFLASKPRDYDGKGGAIVFTRWIEKMESVIENSRCLANQRMKYAASSFVDKALTWWNTQIQSRGREAANGMAWNDFKALLVEELCPSNKIEKLERELWNHTMVRADHAGYINGLAPQIRGMLRATQPATIQGAILTARILTDEAVQCGTLTRSGEKRKEVEGTSKQGGSWKDNKKPKVGKGFVATTPPKSENVGWYPKCTKCYTYHPVSGPCRLCFNCQKPGHFARDYRAPVRQVTPLSEVKMGNNQRVCYECGSPDHLRNTCPKLNRAPGQSGNRLALEGNRTTRNNGNQVKGRAFNFVPLLNVKPTIVSPGYIIEVSNGKKKEVDRIIRDYKLELGNSLFIIDLIPLGHRSFDVIVGMDWLSKHKDEIVCHEKVVRIPLENGEILHVQGECSVGNTKTLMSTKADEPRLCDIPIVRDFAKTKEDHEEHLRLMLELLRKEKLYAKFSKCEFWLQEVHFLGHVINQNGIHVDPSMIEAVKNWKAPTMPS
ncbi:putative reverse transcriptase domain-containing protein [Tanacetum coccineum]